MKNQASKRLKPNDQMERMVKMTKKDQGERGMEKNPLFPPDRKPYMVSNSLIACNVTKAKNA